jgi:hypothetical protein
MSQPQNVHPLATEVIRGHPSIAAAACLNQLMGVLVLPSHSFCHPCLNRLMDVPALPDTQLERVRGLGYEAHSCLVDLGDTAEAVMLQYLEQQKFDCVMIGAGLRAPPQLLLFEKLLNLIHEHALRAKICFNTNPADSVEAVQRWI